MLLSYLLLSSVQFSPSVRVFVPFFYRCFSSFYEFFYFHGVNNLEDGLDPEGFRFFQQFVIGKNYIIQSDCEGLYLERWKDIECLEPICKYNLQRRMMLRSELYLQFVW